MKEQTNQKYIQSHEENKTTSNNHTQDKKKKKMTCVGSETLNEIAIVDHEEKRT